MRVLQQKLMYMGTRVDDDMLGRILLTSVKEVFPTTVEILRNREPAPTLQQVIDRLLSRESEEERSTTKRKAPSDESSPDKCLYCHKPGHLVAECRYKKRDVTKGIQRKCLPNDDEEVNVLEQAEEGFILVTTDQDRLDIGNKWILD
ncbi:unnamed protein product, partial [Aphanomyces euteiches]